MPDYLQPDINTVHIDTLEELFQINKDLIPYLAHKISLEEYCDITTIRNRFQDLLLNADNNHHQNFFSDKDSKKLILECYDKLNQIQERFFGPPAEGIPSDAYIGLGDIDGIIIRHGLLNDDPESGNKLISRIYDAMEKFFDVIGDIKSTSQGELRKEPCLYIITVFEKIFKDNYITKIYPQKESITSLFGIFTQFISVANELLGLPNIRILDTILSNLPINENAPPYLCYQDEVEATAAKQILDNIKKQINKIITDICLNYDEYYDMPAYYGIPNIPTSFETIEETVVLKDYPKKIIPLQHNTSLTIGDVDGNFMKVLYFLVKHEVFKLHPEQFASLANLGEEFFREKQEYNEKLRHITTFMTEGILTQFTEAQQHFESGQDGPADQRLSILKFHIGRENYDRFDGMTIREKLNYFEQQIATSKEQLPLLNTEYKTIFEKIINKFKEVLDNIKVTEIAKSKDVLIRFLGDVFADRGVSDLFTLLVLNILEKANVNFEMLMGNHDLVICSEELFKSEISRTNFPGIHVEQYISYQEGLLYLIDTFDLFSREELHELLKKCFLNRVNIVSYDVETLSPSGINLVKIYSHGVIGVNTLINMLVNYPNANKEKEDCLLELISDFTEVPKQEHGEITIYLTKDNVIKMLTKIRAVFRELIEKNIILEKILLEFNKIAGSLGEEYQPAAARTQCFLGAGQIGSETPYACAMYNRCPKIKPSGNILEETVNNFTLKVLLDEKTIFFFVHGHSPLPEQITGNNSRRSVTNLCTNLGKPTKKDPTGFSTPGTYIVEIKKKNNSPCNVIDEQLSVQEAQTQTSTLLFTTTSSCGPSSSSSSSVETPPIGEDVSSKKVRPIAGI